MSRTLLDGIFGSDATDLLGAGAFWAFPGTCQDSVPLHIVLENVELVIADAQEYKT
jgi:hypothetical protein